jgi:predicted transcriptional regulator
MSRALIPAVIGKNRSRTETAAAILAVARNGEKQVKIKEQSHLSSKRLKLYLEELTKSGLIEINVMNGTWVFTTSQKGIQYLVQYNMISNMLK